MTGRYRFRQPILATLVAPQKDPARCRGRLIVGDEGTGRLELLGVMHFRSRSRLDFLELGKRTQAGCLLLTGAAAGSGQQCENESDESAEDTGHGSGIGRFKENEEEVFSEEGRRRGKSLGRSHISRLAGSRGAWAAGGGEKRSSSGDEGEFHDFNEVVFDWAMT